MSCNQDPIFYNISIEPPKRDPRIAGSPTNIIVLKDNIYAGSKHGTRIHRYDGSGWEDIDQPGGYIIDLAADGSYLYALVYNGDIMTSTMIKKFDPGAGTWTSNEYTLSGHSIQTIYGAGTEIFAGSYYNYTLPSDESKWTYAILYLDATGLKIVKPDTSLLRGAAETSAEGIFLATAGSGVFLVNNGYSDFNDIKSDLEADALSGTSDTFMVGIIENEGNVFAVSNDSANGRNLYIYNAGVFSSNSMGINMTGAMCVWYQHESTVSPPTSVNVNPPAVTVTRGGTQEFSAKVVGLDDQSVTWSLSEADEDGTAIDNNGLLKIDDAETKVTLTVTATSVENPTIEGTALVTLADSGDLDGYVTITGNPYVGNTLKADTSKLGGTGTITYEWKLDDVGISGANASSYKLTEGDLPGDISVTVTRAGMTGDVTSAALTVIDPWKPTLLLLGIRGSINNQGYREILLNRNTGVPSSYNIRTPGDSVPSSVTDRAKYNAGIGKHPVEAILQVPKEMLPSAASEADIPIFASTTLNGLWSYRDGVWNAEE